MHTISKLILKVGDLSLCSALACFSAQIQQKKGFKVTVLSVLTHLGALDACLFFKDRPFNLYKTLEVHKENDEN